MSRIDKSKETEANWWLPGAGGGGMTSGCLMGVEFYAGLMEMFWNSIQVMVAQPCESTRCH